LAAADSDGEQDADADTTPWPVGELRLVLDRPESSDPAEVVLTDQSAVIVADLLYDGLTEAGADGTLRPGLAERWEPGADFVTWTFHLGDRAARRGVSASSVVDTLNPLTIGASAANRGSAAAVVSAGMVTVEAVDETTVLVTLDGPNAGLPWVLSGLPYSVVGDEGRPTGPYDVVSRDNNGMILRAGEHEIQIRWLVDRSSTFEDLAHAVVDGAVVAPGGDVTHDTPARHTYHQTAATRFYVMNARSATLADPEARAAVLSAIDRGQLLADLDLQQGSDVLLSPSDGLPASTLAGAHPNGYCGDACRFDPDAAQAFAERNGGPRMQLSYTGAEQARLAQGLVDQLEARGFAAEASELPPQDLARVIVTGQTDLFGFGWVAPGTSLDAVIPPLLTVDSPANIARVDSPAVAELLAKAAVTADDGQRWLLLNDAHRRAMEQALIIPIATSVSHIHWGPGADRFAVRADGSLDLRAPTAGE
jgi:ABC-type transport system substrate-binding protein